MQAAAQAAERRAQDDIGCACGHRSGTDFSNEDITAIENGQPAASGASPAAVEESRASTTWNPNKQGIQNTAKASSASGSAHSHNFQLDCSARGSPSFQRSLKESKEDVVDLTVDSDDD